MASTIDLGGNILIVKELRQGANTPGQNSSSSRTTPAGSTITLTRDLNAGRTTLLDTATGSVITLPTSTGSGVAYSFVVTVKVTSNNHIIKVGNGTDTMIGYVDVMSPAGTPTQHTDTAGGTDDTLTMNGTTTGGDIGTTVTATDIASGKWLIQGNLVGTGNVATGEFSATVS